MLTGFVDGVKLPLPLVLPLLLLLLWWLEAALAAITVAALTTFAVRLPAVRLGGGDAARLIGA
jgi:hypothetical protein